MKHVKMYIDFKITIPNNLVKFEENQSRQNWGSTKQIYDRLFLIR